MLSLPWHDGGSGLTLRARQRGEGEKCWLVETPANTSRPWTRLRRSDWI